MYDHALFYVEGLAGFNIMYVALPCDDWQDFSSHKSPIIYYMNIVIFADDERVQAEGGLQLNKNEVFALLLYAQTWQQRWVLALLFCLGLGGGRVI